MTVLRAAGAFLHWNERLLLVSCGALLSARVVGVGDGQQNVFLEKAWDVQNRCKHNGAVLPPSSAPVGRGADGVAAMA
jgi:hypothetical protein